MLFKVQVGGESFEPVDFSAVTKQKKSYRAGLLLLVGALVLLAAAAGRRFGRD